MKVRFERRFAQDLRRVGDKQALARIGKAIEEVKAAQGLGELRQMKKLQGYETYYRLRVGDYRLGLEVVGEEVIFVRCLHRREIYRYFP